MRPASAHAYCYSHAFADPYANGHTSTNAYCYLHTMAGNRCADPYASVDPNANALSDAPSTTRPANANPTNRNPSPSSS